MIEYENLKKVNEKLFDKYKESFDETLKSGWYILGHHCPVRPLHATHPLPHMWHPKQHNQPSPS